MGRQNRSAGGIGFALLLAAVPAAVPARAAGGPAFTGVAAGCDSVATVGSNPAGLTRLERGGYVVGVLFAASESDFLVRSSTLPGESSYAANGSSSIPSLGYARPLADGWWFGLSVAGQGGLGSNYEDDWVGRYLLTSWSLVYVGVTPSVALRVNDRLSVAGSLSLNYAAYTQKAAVFNPEPEVGDGEMKLTANDLALGWGVSGLFEISRRTHCGVSYRSEIEPRLTDVPSFRNLGPSRQQQLEDSGALTREIGIGTRLPQSVLAGLYHRLDSGPVLTLDVAWLDFSEFELSQSLVTFDEVASPTTRYRDIWMASAGVRLALREPWELRLGAFRVSDAVDDPDRTFLLRLDDAWGVGAGFERSLGRDQTLTLNLTLVEIGDAPVETPEYPLIGKVSGRYVTRRSALLGLAWTFGGRRRSEPAGNTTLSPSGEIASAP